MRSYLGGDKVGGVAGSHEQPVLRSQLLGKPKVADPDGVWVSWLIHVEDITWLEISVHHLNKKAMSSKWGEEVREHPGLAAISGLLVEVGQELMPKIFTFWRKVA